MQEEKVEYKSLRELAHMFGLKTGEVKILLTRHGFLKGDRPGPRAKEHGFVRRKWVWNSAIATAFFDSIGYRRIN